MGIFDNMKGIVDKELLRKEIFSFVSNYPDVHTKLINACGKTGSYSVPTELYQERTKRDNRILISWKTIKANEITFSQLEKSFSSVGIVVEFINEDNFLNESEKTPLFKKLYGLVGSDNPVSAMISFRSEYGSSSSEIERYYFEKYIGIECVMKNKDTIKMKCQDELIRRKPQYKKGTKGIGVGNEKWMGKLYYSIKGGSNKKTIKPYDGEEVPALFNPACEFATSEVSIDIDLVLCYFTLVCIGATETDLDKRAICESLFNKLKKILKHSKYDYCKVGHDCFKGCLLDYCENHPSVTMVPGKLYDPIQAVEITVSDFKPINRDPKPDKNHPDSIDLTHNEAVLENVFYWDNVKKCILSAARPTNLFWSKHTSNMIQQNHTLNEYFEFERNNIERRNSFRQ